MKSRILVFILFLLPVLVLAQRKKPENLPKFDSRYYHFGFTIGYNNTDFVIKHRGNFTSFDTLLSIESRKKPGFNLGIIGDLHLHDYISLRFVPSLSFANRQLEYKIAHNDTTFSDFVKRVESNFIDLPLYLKYRSARVNNFAAYVIAGGKYSIDLASRAEDITSKNPELVEIKLRKRDIMYEVGFGLDLFLEYFKFSPEIKMSFGVPNVLLYDNTIFTTPIEKLSSRVFLLSFHFEG